mmetsp:Transcript_9869/g.13907  ORF Transcript_9869/g.13907 Transcript_9869/m.13907 type:complete len:321 (+) Transcript_9869:117-1079(+)
MRSVGAFATVAVMAFTDKAAFVASRPAFVSSSSNHGGRRNDAPADFSSNCFDRQFCNKLVQRHDSASSRMKESTTVTSLFAWKESPLGELTSKATSIFKKVLLEDLTGSSEEEGQDQTVLGDEGEEIQFIGRVVRTAARAYMEDGSRPSSRLYTTRKNEFPQVSVDMSGVHGDYNDYRTRAMKGTGDRAISILTSDVMGALRAKSQYEMINDGDLGENICVDDVPFDFFEVGKRYRFSRQRDNVKGGGVIVEITEPAVPCANLCKLPFINDDKLDPAQRIERCQEFVGRLGSAPGLRGWYAKVIEGGTIRVEDSVFLVGE